MGRIHEWQRSDGTDPDSYWTHSCHVIFPQITYIETSAKEPPMNVDKAFHELVRVIRYVSCVIDHPVPVTGLATVSQPHKRLSFPGAQCDRSGTLGLGPPGQKAAVFFPGLGLKAGSGFGNWYVKELDSEPNPLQRAFHWGINRIILFSFFFFFTYQQSCGRMLFISVNKLKECSTCTVTGPTTIDPSNLDVLPSWDLAIFLGSRHLLDRSQRRLFNFTASPR